MGDSPSGDRGSRDRRRAILGGATHFTAEIVARLGVTGAKAEQMVGTPICPPNEDARHEAECRAHDAEARRLKAEGITAAAVAATRAAAAAFCRIGSPARQKRVGQALWGFMW